MYPVTPASKTLVAQDMPAAPAARAPELKVFGHEIRVDDKGRLCLTDMHRAARAGEIQRPKHWLKQESTRMFMEEMLRQKVTQDYLYMTTLGRKGGTYAHWQLALSYAEYLSPELHMEVNQTYMRYKAADPGLAAEMIDKQTDPEVLKVVPCLRGG